MVSLLSSDVRNRKPATNFQLRENGQLVYTLRVRTPVDGERTGLGRGKRGMFFEIFPARARKPSESVAVAVELGSNMARSAIVRGLAALSRTRDGREARALAMDHRQVGAWLRDGVSRQEYDGRRALTSALGSNQPRAKAQQPSGGGGRGRQPRQPQGRGPTPRAARVSDVEMDITVDPDEDTITLVIPLTTGKALAAALITALQGR